MAGFTEQRKLVKSLQKQGFKVTQTKKNHFKVYSPDGERVAFLGGTPGDHRSWKNQISILRHMGYRHHKE